MSDRQIFGQRDRGMLAHRIGGRRQRGQQAGGRGGIEQITFAACLHARHDRARCIDMRHDMDLPVEVPVGIRREFVAVADQPGIRAEHIDRAEALFGGRDQRLHLRLVADITGKGHGGHGWPTAFAAAQTSSERIERARLRRQIGQDQRARSLGGKSQRQCRANAAAGTGNHDCPIGQFHLVSCAGAAPALARLGVNLRSLADRLSAAEASTGTRSAPGCVRARSIRSERACRASGSPTARDRHCPRSASRACRAGPVPRWRDRR